MTSTYPVPFGAALDLAPDGVLMVSRDGVIRYANQQASVMFGRDDLTGAMIEELVPADLRERHVHHRQGFFQHASTRAMGSGLELRATRKDGSEFPVEISLAPVGYGEQMLTMAVVRDRTAQHAQEQQIRTLMELAPDGIVLADGEGNIEYANQQVRDLFGYTPEELVGQKVEMLMPERYRPDHPAKREGYMKHPERRPMGSGLQLVGLRKNGIEFPIDIALATLEGPDGRRAIASIRDATLNHEHEQELRNFAYFASHDLQAPLRHIRGFIGILKEQRERLDEEGRFSVDMIDDSSRRLQDLTDGLLSYSRANTQKMQTSEVDLAQVMADVIGLLQTDIEAVGGKVTFDDLPTVVGDASRLHHLFQNFLTNAMKYRHPDRAPQVHVSCTSDATWHHIAFKDNGKGFDPEYNEKVFGMFQRLERPDESTGAGIGLALCKKIVEQHGGRTWAEGRPGEGATFFIDLRADKKVPA